MKDRYPNCRVVGYKSKTNNPLPVISEYFEWRKVAKIINSLKSDLCFMFDDTSPISNLINVPVFQYVHQYGNRSSKKAKILKTIYRNVMSIINEKFYLSGLKKSKTVFVVSEPIIEILKKKGVKNLVYTPHGINIEIFRNPLISSFHDILKEKKKDGYFIVSYTGWVTENRGYQLMMDSIKETVYVDKKILLVIAGADENFSKRIKEYAKANNLQDNIINFGIIDVSLITGILYYTDVCLSFLEDVPAYRISPPQKIIEYFAAGKPVICNKIQTHEMLVTHRKNGLILDYDVLEVKEAILELKNNQDLINEMSRNAQEEAKKHDINVVYGNLVNKIKASINAN
jgi:glycosyltransferase involved in cell wall biosynthesis